MAMSFLVRAGLRMLAGHVAKSLDEAQAAVDRRDPVAVAAQVRRLRELLGSLQSTLAGVLTGRMASMIGVVHAGVDAMLEGVEARVNRGDFAGAGEALTRVRASFTTLLQLLED